MDENTQPAAATAPEQGAAAPAPDADKPTPSEREKALDTQLKAVSKERDKLKGQVGTLTTEREKLQGQVGTLTTERDEYKTKYEKLDTEHEVVLADRDQYKAKYEEATEPAPAPEATGEQASAAEADPHAETKALLKRFKLPRAYVLPSGEVCFDEKHAKHVAGQDFDTLTVISAE